MVIGVPSAFLGGVSGWAPGDPAPEGGMAATVAFLATLATNRWPVAGAAAGRGAGAPGAAAAGAAGRFGLAERRLADSAARVAASTGLIPCAVSRVAKIAG